MAAASLPGQMRAISSARGWGWPLASATVAFVGVTVLTFSHTQIDLATYLLGGAHARSGDLFSVTYPATHLGFTYPPFSALLFAPFAHLPTRVCEVAFSWLNLAAVFLLVIACLRAVCRTLERRTPPASPSRGRLRSRASARGRKQRPCRGSYRRATPEVTLSAPPWPKTGASPTTWLRRRP